MCWLWNAILRSLRISFRFCGQFTHSVRYLPRSLTCDATKVRPSLTPRQNRIETQLMFPTAFPRRNRETGPCENFDGDFALAGSSRYTFGASQFFKVRNRDLNLFRREYYSQFDSLPQLTMWSVSFKSYFCWILVSRIFVNIAVETGLQSHIQAFNKF